MFRVLKMMVLAFLLITGCGKSLPEQYFDLRLQTLSGEDFGFTRLQEQGFSVFVFLAPDCPLSQNYSLTIREVSEAYAADSIRFFGVFPGEFHTRGETEAFVGKYTIPFTVLLDPQYELTHLIEATVTPEVFVMNGEGRVLYSGAIDNWAYALGKKREVITEHYLRDALAAVTSGKPVEIKRTDPVGCFIE